MSSLKAVGPTDAFVLFPQRTMTASSTCRFAFDLPLVIRLWIKGSGLEENIVVSSSSFFMLLGKRRLFSFPTISESLKFPADYTP